MQLPSAARLSGNSRPCVGGRFLHALQHAAGLGRQRQVGARRCRGCGSGAPGSAAPGVPLASGTEPPTSPVLPPCGTIAAPCARAGRDDRATSAVVAGPHDRERAAVEALAPVDLVGATGRRRRSTCAAPTAARSASSRLTASARSRRRRGAGVMARSAPAARAPRRRRSSTQRTAATSTRSRAARRAPRSLAARTTPSVT